VRVDAGCDDGRRGSGDKREEGDCEQEPGAAHDQTVAAVARI